MAQIGQVPARINGIFKVTLKNFNSTKKTPTVVHKFADGSQDSAQGVPDVDASFTCSVPTTGPELDLDALSVGDGFTITYSLGAKRYGLTNCKVNNEGLKVDNGGGNVTIDYAVTCARRINL